MPTRIQLLEPGSLRCFVMGSSALQASKSGAMGRRPGPGAPPRGAEARTGDG